jgi:hypothetical protein
VQEIMNTSPVDLLPRRVRIATETLPHAVSVLAWSLPENDGLSGLSKVSTIKKKEIGTNTVIVTGPSSSDHSDNPIHTLYYLHRSSEGKKTLLVIRCPGDAIATWMHASQQLAPKLESLIACTKSPS